MRPLQSRRRRGTRKHLKALRKYVRQLKDNGDQRQWDYNQKMLKAAIADLRVAVSARTQ